MDADKDLVDGSVGLDWMLQQNLFWKAKSCTLLEKQLISFFFRDFLEVFQGYAIVEEQVRKNKAITEWVWLRFFNIFETITLFNENDLGTYALLNVE